MGREPELTGQTVVVIGGSSGIGFETARRARAEGADIVLTGRNPERLQRAARELSDAGREVQKDLGIRGYADRHYDPMIPPLPSSRPRAEPVSRGRPSAAVAGGA